MFIRVKINSRKVIRSEMTKSETDRFKPKPQKRFIFTISVMIRNQWIHGLTKIANHYVIFITLSYLSPPRSRKKIESRRIKGRCS